MTVKGDSPVLKLSREAVLDSLSSRISKDVNDALEYIDLHEIVGILEMIKISVVNEMLKEAATRISDEIIGNEVVN